MEPTASDWDARNEAWNARVERLGVERSIYHSKHQAPEFPAVTKLQRDAIWPHFLAGLNGTERTALDFGCGYGRWTPMLAEAVGQAVGVDPTTALLEHARKTPHSPRVTYARYQHGQIPATDQAFDVIWCCMVLSTVLKADMLTDTLAELERVAKPGALVCFIDNTSTVDGRPVRSKYSISRTIEEYQAAFAPWVDLAVKGDYVDFGEINTVFVGRVHG